MPKRQASGKARRLARRTVRSYSGVLVTHMWHCIKFALVSDLRGLEEITDGVETVGSRGERPCLCIAKQLCSVVYTFG